MEWLSNDVNKCKIRANYIENKNYLGVKSINVEKLGGKRISTGLIT